MLEIILVGMLGAVAIVVVAHTVEESLRAFDKETALGSSDLDFDDEPRWRTVRPSDEDRAPPEEREAA